MSAKGVAGTDPKPIGYDVHQSGVKSFEATMVFEGDVLQSALRIARGKTEKGVRRAAARAVVKALNAWEARQGWEPSRVILVPQSPPKIAPKGGSGGSDAAAWRKKQERKKR